MRSPPYGKFLPSDAREIWIYFGSDPWHAAKCRAARKMPVLCLPPDHNPEDFRWPVSGRPVLLIQQGDFEIQKIPAFANLLLSYNAQIVRAIYGDGGFVKYERKSNEKAA